MKVCSDCKQELSWDKFYHRYTSKDSLSTTCKQCNNIRRRKHKEVNKEHTHKVNSKSWFMREYGITLEDRDKMLDNQDYKCYLCGREHSDLLKGLHVDHDHKTGEVRGMLCPRCNYGLGCFSDDPILILNAYKYLTHVAELPKVMEVDRHGKPVYH